MAKSSKSGNDDGRGSQRDARSSAASAKNSSGGSGYSPQSERSPSKSSSSQAPSGASRSSSSRSNSSSSGYKSSSNSDGRGNQREQVRSAQQAKSSIGSGNSGSANRASNSDGRGSQRDTRSSALAGRVGNALSSIGESITGRIGSATNPAIEGAIQSLSSAFGLGPSRNGFRSVVEAGKGYTVVELADGSVIRRDGTRNWRNNNPGNIEYGEFAKKTGAIGTDGRFAVYETYEAGRKAKESLLFDGKNYKDKSIADAISRYAPPHENNTKAYAGRVAKDIGVSLDTKLADLTPAQRTKMLDSMEVVEGFRPGKESPYDAAKKEFKNQAPTSTAYNGVSTVAASLGDMFNELLGTREANAGEMTPDAQPNVQGYRDPMVSTPAGRAARGEKDKAPKEVKDPRRGGFGALEVGLKNDDPLSVGKNLLGAVMNPVGYMLDSIQDGIRNSPEWNSEGPEGQPVNSFGERVANFFNSSTVDQSYRDSGPYSAIGTGNSGSQDRAVTDGKDSESSSSSDAMAQVAPVAAPTSVDLYAQILAQLNSFSLDTTQSGKRKPYEWSTL